jgi:hypothetical protein
MQLKLVGFPSNLAIQVWQTLACING